ncbi:hypothetical protein Desor_3260 [Desulfosporosinus orientis DSM 765]|uniref:Uncharacterized protein n=1 Tax=Desulfosporosinus orientis (strain ATCC 19365 / DSM 765 / NCIMB 8382 / VKM B-1628 / Singapore I) TaxID=768706 RepID=G7WBK5_DESOD|nr:hypothetical protein [Desulfosporosinus orientis]AET68763.1 hypothetical protein Desor_3260 [Desulfosporosinus orientis DSM 765]
MAKIITIERKYIAMVVSVLVICLIGFSGFSFWENRHENVSKEMGTPEIKMLGVTVEPASVVKDLNYGSVTLKGAQVITTKTFDLIVTVQNMTAKKMTNIPVELQVNLIGDDTKKVISPGSLQSLEPGATARIAFRQIKVLGDALGKSATDGQHLITIRIKANPEGGVEQATEASFRFNVDTTVKVPSTVNKQ